MGFIEKIPQFFSSNRRGDEAGYWIYVSCSLCGEKLSTRINLYNDLSINYTGPDDQTYICRKTIVGREGCFQRIEIKLYFDRRRNLKDQEISGGAFIEERED
jgi:hypothetical protein